VKVLSKILIPCIIVDEDKINDNHGLNKKASKNRNLNACVLFMDHHEILKLLNFNKSSMITKAIGVFKR